MGKTQIKKDLTIFTRRVKEKFKPEQILLFGSYARGEATQFSDIDIVVVAKGFKKIPFADRLDVLYPLSQDLYPDFHVFGYTPDEFAHLSPVTTIFESKAQGISLL